MIEKSVVSENSSNLALHVIESYSYILYIVDLHTLFTLWQMYVLILYSSVDDFILTNRDYSTVTYGVIFSWPLRQLSFYTSVCYVCVSARMFVYRCWLNKILGDASCFEFSRQWLCYPFLWRCMVYIQEEIQYMCIVDVCACAVTFNTCVCARYITVLL